MIKCGKVAEKNISISTLYVVIFSQLNGSHRGGEGCILQIRWILWFPITCVLGIYVGPPHHP